MHGWPREGEIEGWEGLLGRWPLWFGATNKTVVTMRAGSTCAGLLPCLNELLFPFGACPLQRGTLECSLCPLLLQTLQCYQAPLAGESPHFQVLRGLAFYHFLTVESEQLVPNESTATSRNERADGVSHGRRRSTLMDKHLQSTMNRQNQPKIWFLSRCIL